MALVLLMAGLFAVAARLVYLQVYAAPAFAEKAAAQRTRDIEIAPKRGTIYDRDGEPLAVSREARTVYASPRLVVDPQGAAQALAGVLGGDVADYAERLQRDSGFVYIARKTDMERAERVEALDIAGIGTLKDSRRTYPAGDIGAQVLGFVGVDDTGLAGLEQYYEELLAGEPGSILAERDPFGRLIPGGVMHFEEPVDGHDIRISVDKDIQYVAQDALQRAVDEWDATSGSVIVMDPRSGEILAMASVPGFNPNRFGEAEPDTYRNRAATDAFEPGSTFKTVTAASVLDAGLFAPDSVLELPPTLQIGGRRIGEARPRGTVEWTLTELITQSSNIGAVKLAQALGEEAFYDYIRKFGFTQPTGIDFPGEATGYMPPLEQWSATSIANIPFGQGVSVTTLQLARATAAIANGGELVTPHFLLDGDAAKSASGALPRERVISESAAEAAREVLKAAAGDPDMVEGYEVAGKTGTAQKARADGRGYAGGGYIGSFVGFLPADDPQVLVVVVIDEPQGAYYGRIVAVPVFAEVAQFAVSHLRIPPAPVTGGAVTESESATGVADP